MSKFSEIRDESYERSTAFWRGRPLCCSYIFVEFKNVHLVIREADAVTHFPWRCAIGLFSKGEYEVLGAWPAGIAPAQICDDLRQRGVERIMTMAAEDGFDCASRFPDAAMASVSDDSAGVGAPGAALLILPRQRAALQLATTMSKRFQASITRAIKRQAPFADEAAAVAFLSRTLESADRRLQGLSKLTSKTARRQPAAVAASSLAASRSLTRP